MDEPTTALDVVVQREILQQVRDLQRELGFAVLFITHDLSLLFEIADRIAIMYAGEIVEEAPAERSPRRGAAPVHASACSVVPVADRPARADDRDPRRAARPRDPAGRLPLPPALPALQRRTQPRSTRCRRPSARCCARSRPGTASPAISWRAHDDDAIDARGARPDEALPVGGDGLSAGAQRARRRRRLVRAAARARSRRSSARAAAARARSHACSPASTSRPRARCSSTAATSPRRASRARRPALPLAGADDLPGPVRLAEPGEDGASPPRATAAASTSSSPRERDRRRACASCSTTVGLVPPEQIADEVPARAVRRPAAARRDRARARRRADRHRSPTSRRRCSTCRSASGSST